MAMWASWVMECWRIGVGCW